MRLPFAQNAAAIDQDKFLWDLSIAFGTTLDETVDALAYVATCVHNVIVGDMRGALKRELNVEEIPQSLYPLMKQTMPQYPENAHLVFLLGLSKVRSKLSGTVIEGPPEQVEEVKPEFWERLDLERHLFAMGTDYKEAQEARKLGLN